jgi:hypothetical protein
MKDKTIDYILRATWQAAVECIYEEAYDASMATGFALLSIDRRWNAIDFFRSKDGISNKLD